jgi:hypothetical protein
MCFTSVSNISGVPVFVGVPAAADVPTVVGVPAFVDVPAVAGVPSVVNIPFVNVVFTYPTSLLLASSDVPVVPCTEVSPSVDVQ